MSAVQAADAPTASSGKKVRVSKKQFLSRVAARAKAQLDEQVLSIDVIERLLGAVVTEPAEDASGDAVEDAKQRVLDRNLKVSDTMALTEIVYEAAIAELMDCISSDQDVVLTGFGRFYKQMHKGHRVQFAGDDGKPGYIDDYPVLKFSSTVETNRKLDPKHVEVQVSS